MNYRAIAALSAFILGIATLAFAESGARAITVEMKTNVGTVVMQLDAQRAPKSVQNFVKYAQAKHYEGTVFHRVIDGFMIQGGGLDQNLKEKPTLAPIANEAANGLKNEKYSVAMARTSDPNSATCQFFINTNDNTFLNRDEAQDGYGYAVFGFVTDGKEVVDQISKVKTEVQTSPDHKELLMRDVPVQPIVIQSITVLDGA